MLVLVLGLELPVFSFQVKHFDSGLIKTSISSFQATLLLLYMALSLVFF